MQQQGLWDEAPQAAAPPVIAEKEVARPFKEIPHFVFERLSTHEQLTYLAARDEDSATDDRLDDWNRAFLLKRAETYRERAKL